ncbi:hypothetical protein TPENAI_50267 [Tenacibaculum litopenaei]|jgi:hypothetical protein|uniref:hypothetical protein n=1 Tax=Tenacibaculum litopenaei TaxID=396016 RepID=UPI0038941AC3
MKNLIIGLAILIPTALISQENASNNEYIETTSIEKITALEDGKITTKKVKIVTREEEAVLFDPHQKNELNQDRIASPIEITKVLMTDKDEDSYYDTVDKLDIVLAKEKTALDGEPIDTINHQAVQTIETNRLNLTGEGYFNEQGDYLLIYFDSDDQEQKVLKLSDVF